MPVGLPNIDGVLMVYEPVRAGGIILFLVERFSFPQENYMSLVK